MIAGRRAFILQHTALQRPPHTPELQLYLAGEVTPLWRMTEAELGARGVPPPFWAFAWAGGLALARYLLDHPQEVAGRRVLDFAAGSGLCALAAMKAGAASALAADIDPYAEAAVALNCEANGLRVASPPRICSTPRRPGRRDPRGRHLLRSAARRSRAGLAPGRPCARRPCPDRRPRAAPTCPARPRPPRRVRRAHLARELEEYPRQARRRLHLRAARQRRRSLARSLVAALAFLRLGAIGHSKVTGSVARAGYYE